MAAEDDREQEDGVGAGADEGTVHARGFHSFGPPTMCGDGKPSTEVVVEVTCERCFEILSSAASLAARMQVLHAAGVRPVLNEEYFA
jgi:hypothetical protein